ncbi:MAG TPA: UDP-glucose 4-epimerase GalE [Candidatus Sulfotelmatobacter sp.]|jgi:UDP-glucose 4-epimerase|nr:UDP-glucose 4-epimerase GalE [Candidatus Sulfotelmatobacter sp.]
MKVLVTGGAGYIGSFMAKRLLDEGHDVTIADSLERGHESSLDSRANFVKGNLLEKEFINKLFSQYTYDCVMHFAAYIAVGESMQHPGLYFRDNVFTTISLLDAMKEHGTKKFIFSSTGTVYGTPMINPIPETYAKNPENPYAESKYMVEKILHWYYISHGIGSAVLRYFNASGAALDGSSGEDHDPETHLIPNAIRAALHNTEFQLFGADYETRDGTCIRDYIHVLDLVEAHVLTLQKLDEKNGEYVYNVGTGRGSTNKEIIDMVKKISGIDFPIVVKDRRSGDVAETVADPSKIREEIGFQPRYSDLETIIKTAWEWHKNQK